VNLRLGIDISWLQRYVTAVLNWVVAFCAHQVLMILPCLVLRELVRDLPSALRAMLHDDIPLDQVLLEIFFSTAHEEKAAVIVSPRILTAVCCCYSSTYVYWLKCSLEL